MAEDDDVLAGGGGGRGGVVALQTVCMVHTHYAPCPRNGEPASTGALHAEDINGPAEAVRFWWLRTRGQRTLLLHHGTFGDDRELSAGCWCEPEVFLATDEPSLMPEV